MRGIQWSSMKRSRWAAIGAAIAVTVGSGGLMSASADISSGEKPVFVSITPCRVADTRPTETVGPRNTALTANETYTLTVRGTNGNCTIPADAVGVAVNVTAVFPTASSFFTLFPADAATRPLSSNLNFVGDQPPVSNSASIRLSADGKMSIYNLAGAVHFTLDITGYYGSHDHNDLYYTKAEVDANPLVPVAVIHVLADGSLQSEAHRAPITAAPTSTKADIGRYDVSLPGIIFFYNTDVANCTTAEAFGRFVSVVSLAGGLRVFVFDPVTGNQADGGFYCSVYNLG